MHRPVVFSLVLLRQSSLDRYSFSVQRRPNLMSSLRPPTPSNISKAFLYFSFHFPNILLFFYVFSVAKLLRAIRLNTHFNWKLLLLSNNNRTTGKKSTFLVSTQINTHPTITLFHLIWISTNTKTTTIS